MDDIEAILSAEAGAKEKVRMLSDGIVEGRFTVEEVLLEAGSRTKADKGNLVEALEGASKRSPELFDGRLGRVSPLLSDGLPRVRWESARVLANLAPTYPRQASKAIPGLLKNAEDEGTVVRWSAALALTGIARADPASAKRLAKEFERILGKEGNNGVRNIYLEYLGGSGRGKKA